jgi:glycosyltransferase involved in cell wall biosynthesis
MSRRLVKVIVPCYGYAKWLQGCVASALDQPGVDVRVLVIDDCSPDDTPEVSARLMEADSRIEYRRHDENRGLIGTINHGLAWADDSDYVVVLSADDFLVPGSLGRAVEVMEASPNVGLVYGPAQYLRGEGPPPAPGGRWRRTTVWSGDSWVRNRCRSAHNCISSPEVVVRTTVHRAAGHYDPNCVHASDLNMWLRIAAISDVAFINGIPQAHYRVHSDSMLRSNRDPLLDLRERHKAFESLFASCGGELARCDELRAMVGRALARQALWAASRAVDRGLTDGPDALPVDGLVRFALDVCPTATRLREWHGLRLRRAIGSGRSRWFPPFVVTGAAHRALYHVRRVRTMTSGL